MAAHPAVASPELLKGFQCSLESQMATAGGQTSSVIEFQNRTARPVDIFWLDQNAARKRYLSVAPGGQGSQQTYDGHNWLVAGKDGACIAIYRAGAGRSRAVITGRAEVSDLDGPLPQVTGSQAVGPLPDTIRKKYSLSSFYKQYLDSDGLPVLASGAPAPQALAATSIIMRGMLAGNDLLRQTMIDQKVRVAVIGRDEGTSVIPEYAELLQTMPNLDERARGMGGQVSSAGEENVLCLTRDRYRGESILVHEFAHTILNFGIIHVHPGFRSELETTFAGARKAGLWERHYASTNPDEYWAEGVQSYFDTNLESDPPNGVHNHVNTREELRAYDPRLYSLIHRIFKETRWRYACTGRQPR